MIPAYNCFETLKETIHSVLQQDPGTEIMQIEVIDDASTDGDVQQLVLQMGGGRIGYYRQEQNVGSLRNFETCINRARGILVHLLHGDDRVRAGYYQRIGKLFEQYPHIGAAFCRFVAIDENGCLLWEHGKEMDTDGVLDNWLSKIASRQRLQYCTITVKRAVYEKLGGFYGVTYGEDWEMWVRIAAHFDVAYTPETLADYRVHRNSISHQAFLAANHVKDMAWVIDAIQKWLPESERDNFRREASRNYSQYAIDVANKIWHQTGNRIVTHRLIMESLRMHLNWQCFNKMVKIYIKMLLNRR